MGDGWWWSKKFLDANPIRVVIQEVGELEEEAKDQQKNAYLKGGTEKLVVWDVTSTAVTVCSYHSLFLPSLTEYDTPFYRPPWRLRNRPKMDPTN